MNGNEQKLYILLTNTGSLLNRAIKICTKAPYNHVSLGFDSQLKELFSFGRLRPRNPFIGGFVHEDPEGGTFAHFCNTTCALYEFTVTPEQYVLVRENVRQFEQERLRYTFNLIGFAGFSIGRPINRRYAYFCSQFVATVLQRSGIYLSDKPPGLMTPADFQKSTRLKLLYEGRLADYRKSMRNIS